MTKREPRTFASMAVIGFVLVVCGLGIEVVSTIPPETKDALTTVSGRVQFARRLRSRTPMVELVLASGGRLVRLRQYDFTRETPGVDTLRLGQDVEVSVTGLKAKKTFLRDMGEDDGRLWAIRRGGEEIASYEQVRAFVLRKEEWGRRFGSWIALPGALLMAVGLNLWWFLERGARSRPRP